MTNLDKIKKYVYDYNTDAILITSNVDKFYISGLDSSAGYLFITKSNQYIIVDFRYFEEVQSEKYSKYTVLMTDKKNTYFDIINDICKKENISNIGFDGCDLSFNTYKDMEKKINQKLSPISLKELRSKKSSDEVGYIKRACQIVDTTFENIVDFIKVGMTEREVENEIIRNIRCLGGEKESFNSIVASGVRGALPHGRATEKVIEKGDFVTFDFGARFNRYCSDITRTICMGETNPELLKIYKIVKVANEKAIESVRAGMTTGEVDKIARDIIDNEGYGEFFGHSLGHGLGIMVHEYPTVNSGGDTILEEGMVITIEPGIYIPNLGGVRIEDDILVTSNGCEVLTKATKELIIK